MLRSRSGGVLRRAGRTRLAMALAVVAIAGLSWLLIPSPSLEYDTAYALVWGGEVSDGRLPDYAGGPTPHLLVNLVAAAAVSVVGREAAYVLVAAIGYIAWGVLLVGLFRLGQVAGSVAIGLLACLVIATSGTMVSNAASASKDIVFAALVVAAAALVTQRPRRWGPVLLILGLAGLIRPEAWLLAGAYWLYLFRSADRHTRVVTGALVASAPLIWMASDWIVTGQPLYSLSHTRDLTVVAEKATGLAQRETGIGHVPRLAESGLADLLGRRVVLGGLAGLILAVAIRRRRLLPIAAVAMLAALLYTLQGVAGVPLNVRGLIVLGTALAVFFGFAVAGWTHEENRLLRRGWSVAGLVLLLGVSLAVPSTMSKLRQTYHGLRVQSHIFGDLRELTFRTSVRTLLTHCSPLGYRYFDTWFAQAAYLSNAAGRPHTTFIVLGRTAPPRGVLVLPTSYGTIHRELASRGSTGDNFDVDRRGYREVAHNDTWAAYKRGCE